jgi:hypothetical protein
VAACASVRVGPDTPTDDSRHGGAGRATLVEQGVGYSSQNGGCGVVAFSVAIPLLAALVMVNQLETIRRRQTKSVIVAVTRAVAQTAAFIGVIAGFWHMSWTAGLGMLASGSVAIGVHSAAYVHHDRDMKPKSSP